MEGISISMQHYIKAIYELSDDDVGVRISDIASRVGVTKTSAFNAIKVLQKKDLVKRDTSRLVFLTDAGERQAIQSYDKYTIIKQFLEDVLRVDNKVAAVDACAMEHVVSLDTLCSFCRFMNKGGKRHQCMGGCHEPICDSLPNS